MKLQYDFSPETHNLFYGVCACWECGQNVNLQHHHIWGRISDSPLNLAVLCQNCHARITGTREEKTRYLSKTIEYICLEARRGLQGHYFMTDNDENFIKLIHKDLSTDWDCG